MGLVSSMLQESVQGVSVNCSVEPATRVRLVPKVPPVIFAGQHLILYARVTPDTTVRPVFNYRKTRRATNENTI